MTTTRLVTLSKTHFLFITLCLLFLGVVCVVAVFSPYTIYNLKCSYLDLPAYEKEFSFSLGEMHVPSSISDSGTVAAITAVEPTGVFARSGVRVGDIPQVHHGSADFCGALSAAREGSAVELRVYNVIDAKAGKGRWREIQLRMR